MVDSKRVVKILQLDNEYTLLARWKFFKSFEIFEAMLLLWGTRMKRLSHYLSLFISKIIMVTKDTTNLYEKVPDNEICTYNLSCHAS